MLDLAPQIFEYRQNQGGNTNQRFFGVSVPAVRDCSVWPVFRAGCHPIWEKRNEVKLWKRKNFNQLVSLRSL